MPKILLVEEDRTLQSLLVNKLREANYDVVVAQDGFSGVTLAQMERPSLILMSTGLPKLNGWQAAEQLKASTYTRQIPIVALTPTETCEGTQPHLRAGCEAIFAKTTPIPMILSQIEQLLTA